MASRFILVCAKITNMYVLIGVECGPCNVCRLLLINDSTHAVAVDYKCSAIFKNICKEIA